MKKFNTLFLVCILTLGCLWLTGCKKGCEKNGHQWIEADYKNPKTCKICQVTEGFPRQETIETLKEANKELEEKSYTSLSANTIIMTIGNETTTNVSTSKILCEPTKMLIETTTNDMTNKIFSKINNNEVTLYLLNNQTWTKMDTIPLDEYNIENSYLDYTLISEDLFKLENGIWVGDCDKVSEYLSDYINEISSSIIGMGAKINQYTIDKFNMTLDNGSLVKAEINITLSLTINGITASFKNLNTVVYNNIGSTTVNEPLGIE